MSLIKKKLKAKKICITSSAILTVDNNNTKQQSGFDNASLSLVCRFINPLS